MNDGSMEMLVKSELGRLEKERLNQYNDNQLRNVRRTECVESFETARARWVGEELIRRCEWVNSPLKNESEFTSKKEDEEAAGVEVSALALISCVLLCQPARRGRRGKRGSRKVQK